MLHAHLPMLGDDSTAEQIQSQNCSMINCVSGCSLVSRYAAAFPEEDGYRRAETLNEDVLGTELWTAARVQPSAFAPSLPFLRSKCSVHTVVSAILEWVGGADSGVHVWGLQSRKSLAQMRPAMSSVSLEEGQSNLALLSSSFSEGDVTRVRHHIISPSMLPTNYDDHFKSAMVQFFARLLP